MSRSGAKLLGGLASLVFVSLGVAPLVQWFAFDHANGPIAVVFAHPDEPWVWIWPMLLCGAATVVMLLCGLVTDGGETKGSSTNGAA